MIIIIIIIYWNMFGQVRTKRRFRHRPRGPSRRSSSPLTFELAAYFHSPAEFRTSTKSIGRVHSIYRSVGRALCSVGHLVAS